jgi:hypothetical protein
VWSSIVLWHLWPCCICNCTASCMMRCDVRSPLHFARIRVGVVISAKNLVMSVSLILVAISLLRFCNADSSTHLNFVF